jgi:hypothetical protein
VKWTVFGVLRFRDGLSSLYDKRTGAIVRAPAGPRLTFSAGYLARHVNPAEAGFRSEQWLFGGPTLTFTQRPVTARAAFQYERHVRAQGRDDFNRYRPRIDVERVRRGLSPFLFEELTFLREGLVRSRSRAGARYRFRSGSMLEAAYQFESLKRDSAWRPRNAVHLSLSLGVLVEEP